MLFIETGLTVAFINVVHLRSIRSRWPFLQEMVFFVWI